MPKRFDIKEAVPAVFFALYYITIDALFYRNNVLTLILVMLGGIVVFTLWHEKEDILFFILGCAAGATVEIICVHFGVWSYTNPYFLGIPLWLIPDWGVYLVVLNRVEKTVKKLI